MTSCSTYFLLVTLALLLSCGDQKNSASTNSAASAATTITRQSTLIHHNSFGEGPYTLLFVHGWCINSDYWSNQVEALKSKYKIVTIDLPGYGQSGKDREQWSIEAYADDVNAVIKQLDLKNVILVGHSMGGNIVLEAAIKNPDIIAIIGVDHFKESGSPLSEQEQQESLAFLQLLKNNYQEIAIAFAAQALFHPSTDSLVVNRVLGDIQQADPNIAVAGLEALFEHSLVEPQRLAALQQKLYLINSDASPTESEGLDKIGVNYEIIDIEATGHYPMVEKPMEFNRLLEETIKQIIKGDS
jgi:pimeloyl-ACP methyl ester carboxylesterase